MHFVIHAGANSDYSHTGGINSENQQSFEMAMTQVDDMYKNNKLIY